MISDKYRILATLGQGGMGTVYRAEQLGPDGEALREVALKTVVSTHATNEVFARRFLREVRVTASMSSPHIVTVYDAGKAPDGALYFAMELVRGETLAQVIQREAPLPAARVARIAVQICDALAEAHKSPQSIVHRDLKPPNVFVVKTAAGDFVKVADFGIAKSLAESGENLTGTGHMIGTPRYMPPEQWRGEEIDGRADLYALGAILFEMLTRNAPFPGNIEAMMYKHLHEAPPPLPDSVPVELKSLVLGLLEKDKTRRPADAATVRATLERFLAGRPPAAETVMTVAVSDALPATVVTAAPSPAAAAAALSAATPAPAKPAESPAPATPRKPRSWRGAIAALVLLALAGAGGAVFYRSSSTSEPTAGPPASAPGESGFVESITDPEGAEIYVDGKMVGRTPFTAEVPPGRYEIELRKAGYYSARQTAVVKPNQRVQIELALVAEDSR